MTANLQLMQACTAEITKIFPTPGALRRLGFFMPCIVNLFLNTLTLDGVCVKAASSKDR
jgi:hypothetical protein